jgi:hypothetical protein
MNYSIDNNGTEYLKKDLPGLLNDLQDAMDAAWKAHDNYTASPSATQNYSVEKAYQLLNDAINAEARYRAEYRKWNGES